MGNAPPKIVTAYTRGRSKRTTPETHCYADYPHCPYSAKTMLYILDIHAYLFQSDTNNSEGSQTGSSTQPNNAVNS